MKPRKPRLHGDPQWAMRRRWLIVMGALCWLTILYVLFSGLDTKPAEAAVTLAFIVIGAMTGSYVFGAAWERVGGVPSGNYFDGGFAGPLGPSVTDDQPRGGFNDANFGG
jgi:hypothetical protein